MSCPVQGFDSFRLEFGMTFVEALWLILAWRSNTTVNGRNLESGATLTCYHECEGTQELDRWRISTFRHTQYIFEEDLFFTRSEVPEQC